MKIENIDVIIDSEIIFIIGEWTLPIGVERMRQILDAIYSQDVNDGLFEIPSTEKTCLSVFPNDVAKIALSQNQIKQIKHLLNIN
jgi:hypothetical protein